MVQIVRKDGRIYYGERPCKNAEEAYDLFRDEYHASIGRQAFLRLNRIGQRSERIHEFGFEFSRPIDGEKFRKYGTVHYGLLGRVGISYSRIFGLEEYFAGRLIGALGANGDCVFAAVPAVAVVPATAAAVVASALRSAAISFIAAA